MPSSSPSLASKPFRIALAGLTHGHIKTFYRSPRTNIELVGLSEPDAALREAYRAEHGLDPSILFADLGEMLDKTRPEAVAAFGSIYEHLEVMEAAAPRGIHVMVEKPLAVSIEHAGKMAALARRHNIRLITNYETTWYATTHRAIELVTEQDQIGAVRKMVIHDGHRGPQEIDCSPAFLNWLTDPVQNGAGALVDFGCYGANLMTRLMGGAPLAVTGFTRQFKPGLYPKVDDDSTIIVDYPSAQGIIQGSWNWAVSRKDMELYGERGYVVAEGGSTLRTRHGDTDEVHVVTLPDRPSPLDEPFAHLASVIRGETVLEKNDLAELDNNLIVVRILELARRSAAAGRTIRWDAAD